MARITDYATLVQAVQDYLARSDLAGFVPNFIQNCESKIYMDLNLNCMETALSGTIDANGHLAVPADFNSLRFAYIASTPITWLTPEPIEALYRGYPTRSSSGLPKFIAIEGSNFIFGPFPDSGYTVQGIYYAMLPALSSTNTTNWFITNAPDLLLYGALLEAEPFLGVDERIQTWGTLFNGAFERVERNENRSRHSGGSLAARVS